MRRWCVIGEIMMKPIEAQDRNQDSLVQCVKDYKNKIITTSDIR